MDEPYRQLEILLALGGAALLFLLEMALSVALVSVSALSRVALRRLSSEAAPRLAFVEGLGEPPSGHRMAASILRQLALMGGTLLLVLAGQLMGWPYPGVTGLALGALCGVLFLEATVARSLALWEPRSALRRSAFLMPLAYALLWPVVQPLSRLQARLVQIPPADSEEREEEQEEEVDAFIEVGEREGIFEGSASRMMRSIVDLDETYVREIMTPRPDIVALPEQTRVAEARRVLVRDNHSRLPVFRETIDNVIGVLHVRDLLRVCDEGKDDETIAAHVREVMFVPEMLSVADLLGEMRVRSHLAMVVDEYGGVAGLVTLEDVLEEIVGDIRDEHDEEEEAVRQEQDGAWLIDAATHVSKLEELFDIEIGERDFDTVGGLVVSKLGRVPAIGEELESFGLRFAVVEADRRRVHLVRVRQVQPDEVRARS